MNKGPGEAVRILVRVFSDVLEAFLYFDICHYNVLVANIKIWKSHLNIREGSDYSNSCSLIPMGICGLFFAGKEHKTLRKKNLTPRLNILPFALKITVHLFS